MEESALELKIRVMRSDSYSRNHVMYDDVTLEEAMRIVKEKTALGHHQDYWFEYYSPADKKPPEEGWI